MSIENLPACRWCGHIHGDLCPSVKALEYHEDGTTVKRVEFLTPADRLHSPIDEWKGSKS